MVKLDDNAGKKRKKAERVSAAPIDEEALGFSISIKKDDELSKKRHAIRIRLKGLEVHIHRLKKRFPVMDISATGLGFAFEKPRFKGGVELDMDLILNGEVKAQNVLCKVMRHERGTVGCTYVDPDRAQDDTIHALVLLGQKQQAERKSRKKDEAFNLPD
ncbi:PilZ domain-containing protein [Pseudodesulfovibrio cashew]|nr:PilZ domain-containing protein [Pseudodesulfovibrio cashew]